MVVCSLGTVRLFTFFYYLSQLFPCHRESVWYIFALVQLSLSHRYPRSTISSFLNCFLFSSSSQTVHDYIFTMFSETKNKCHSLFLTRVLKPYNNRVSCLAVALTKQWYIINFISVSHFRRLFFHPFQCSSCWLLFPGH